MPHMHELRWMSGATPEGAYRARLYKDLEGKRVAILEAASDNRGPSPINAASAPLRDAVSALWTPPPDRVLVAQQPTVPGSNWYDEIDESGEPCMTVPAELVERWSPVTE